MEQLSFGLEQITSGNGIAIAVTGMLVVFAGLAGICLFIAFLSRLLGCSEKVSGKGREGSSDLDIAAAIGIVVDLEVEQGLPGFGTRITIRRRTRGKPLWAIAGRIRSLFGG